MRRVARVLAALATAAALTACTPASPVAAAPAEYLVFHTDDGRSAAVAAVEKAGGTVTRTETKLGYLIVQSSGARFAETVGQDPAVVGVAADRAIGRTAGRRVAGPAARAFPDASAFEARKGDPLSGRQWDMRMIGADVANEKEPGKRDVLVGVIDTGIDGNHPDIAANFNRELSRNFVTDRPKDDKGENLDGPCEVPSCKDPVDRDDDGHGTHVASTIAAPINGIGIAGVAPNVQLVNIRAGQDSGFFFLKASLDALTYAGDIGVDVVNMSYYVDPWLFNCRDNPSDSEKERLEQRAIITGMQRALDYARDRGVTLISALGNGATDLGKPKTDSASPGYPRGDARVRKIDNSCLNVPAESDGVISVASVGPSGRKAIYSDYGVEQADVAAPGGDTLDGRGASVTRSILAAAPEQALRAKGRIGADGKPKGPDVVRDCARGTCAYYQYLDGTSMAAPHAAGVAAILISRFGKPGKEGFTLDPATVEKYLYETATPVPCPDPRAYVYDVYGEKTTHVCEGNPDKNGFYGHGIVNALAAATFQP